MQRNREEEIIKNYEDQEHMMILIYAQWCINNDLDPLNLYNEAYPDQMKNQALLDALESTVPKKEADDIDDETVLNVLQVFGNIDLAMVVQKEIEKRES